MFFCARSMTASRSASFCRFSVGALLGLFQRIAEPVRDRIEALVDACAASCDWPLRQHADHGLEPRRGFGLGAR